MVSALLMRKDHNNTIKLVHSQVVARDTREAISSVVDRLQVEYAGYTVLDTLATQLDESRNECPGQVGLWADASTAASRKAKGLHHWRPSTRS